MKRFALRKESPEMARECEAKLKVADLRTIRRKLAELGAADEGECMERNWVFDRPDGALRKQGVLLRLRSMGDPGGIVTVKHRVEDGAFKTREEVETMIDSTDDFLRQMEIVGFAVAWIYEKVRNTWLFHDCVLALDECPEIGTFVEIEGDPEKISETARLLDLNPDDHIDDNYLGLWQKHLQAKGENPRHMLFPPETAARKMHSGRNPARPIFTAKETGRQ